MKGKTILYFCVFIILINNLHGQYGSKWYTGRARQLDINGKLEPFNPPALTLFTYRNNILSSAIDNNVHLYFSNYHFTMTDYNGEIVFLTNGLKIFDRLGRIMENGDSINLCLNKNTTIPSGWRNIWLLKDTTIGAYNDVYGCAAIPYPGKENEYLLIYTCHYYDSLIYDNIEINYAHISMNYNSGFGKVLLREEKLLSGIMLGNPIIFRHANGRDWWILTYSQSLNDFYFFLVDYQGIRLYNKVTSGPEINGFSSTIQNKLSPDGNLFVKIDQCQNLSIYRVDRCQGHLEFIKSIFIEVEEPSCFFLPNSFGAGAYIQGIEFSPNSKLLYIIGHHSNNYYNVYQLNLTDYSVERIFKPVQYSGAIKKCQVLFNDKIYIDNESELNMHVIRRPNLKALSSDMDLKSIPTMGYRFDKIQVAPNYKLERVIGSICDTL